MNSYNSFVFTIDGKTIMAAQTALKQCLDICGYTTQNDRNKIVINEGITFLHDIGILTDKEIFLMACNAARRRFVPAPDGTIYIVDINGTHYWGSI